MKSHSMRLYEKQLAQPISDPRAYHGGDQDIRQQCPTSPATSIRTACQAWRAVGDMCAEALRQRGRADTRQLAPGLMKAKGAMDTADTGLTNLFAAEKRGPVKRDGKRKAVSVWTFRYLDPHDSVRSAHSS